MGGIMYNRLSPENRSRVDAIFAGLSVEERIGQTFNVHAKKMSPDEIVKLYEECPFGAVFYAYRRADETAAISEALQSAASIPVIGSADLVNGAGSRIEGCTLFPWQMAVGATDSEECAENMGKATAVEGRAAGIHWTFGPIVDLSINIGNSMMHTRSFGDDPSHVTRISRAFIRGVQAAGGSTAQDAAAQGAAVHHDAPHGAAARGPVPGGMVATAKHFPGDGIDDRDSHICTSINSLEEKEWMRVFAPIWKGAFDEGVGCVMSGHIALPWIDPATDFLGPRPATLSSKIQIDLLRDRLGFDGVVISDAIPMIGFSAFAPYHVRVPANIESGSDMILWPDPKGDIAIMKRALESGILSEARLSAAAKNVLALKLALGLFDSGASLTPDAAAGAEPRGATDHASAKATGAGTAATTAGTPPADGAAVTSGAQADHGGQAKPADGARGAGGATRGTATGAAVKPDSALFQEWADEIGRRSVCVVRNEKNLLPLSLQTGAKVLTVSCAFDEDTRGFVKELSVVDEELRARGFTVEHLLNPGNDVLNARCREFDAIFMNVHVMPRYGTTRMFGQIASIFWNSFWHDHDNVVFTSFGDPYKLYEMPYVPNFVLTFSNTPSSQRAAVATWLGEIEPAGTLPVSLPGYFEREVRP